ncbi:MAG: PEP-CTERM system TPR-repeat protein PrsT [Halioglobus sp.]|nr:PEP-CTERM system TPR-repeat protein PrsT [Halioglobus sp.]
MLTKLSCLLGLSLVLILASPAMAQTQSEHYERGVQAYATGEYTEAFIHLKNALQVDSRFLPARLLLAKVHFNVGDIPGSIKEAEEALDLGADLNLILPVYGMALILQRRISDLFELEKQYDSLTEDNKFEWALLKGQGLLIRGEQDAARREFEAAAAMFPSDVRSANTLASVYLRSGLREEAAQLIEKSLLLDPDNVKTLELEADLALLEGRKEKALVNLERAHELDSTDLRVLRGLARAHMLMGNQLEVERYLELILEQSPEDPAATLLSAIIEIERGETELGDAMLSDLSLKLSELGSILPQSSDKMLFIQAAADYARGSDRSSIALFNKYLPRYPRDLAAIRMLSDLYVRNGESARARELLSSKREVIVDDLGLMIQLLRLYIKAGAELSARETLDELRLQIDDQVLVAVLEGELNRSVGKPAAALALLEDRDYGAVPMSYGLLRGALLLDLNQLDEALRVARELQNAYPQAVRVHNFAGIAHLRSGQLDDAEAAIESALRLSETDVQARFNKAMLLKMRGELETAAVLLNEILAETPGHVRSIMLMADILQLQGKRDDAIEWSRKVYAYDKTSVLPEKFQLDLYIASENWPEALKTVVQLIKLDPIEDSYQVKQAEIYMVMRDFELAQRPLRSLFALWEKEPEKLRVLAAMQIRSRNLAEARLSLETALKQRPDSMPVMLDLARLDVLQQDYDGAEGKLSVLQDRFGQNSEILTIQANIALSRGSLERAQELFMQALQLDNQNVTAIGSLYELALQGVGGPEFIRFMEGRLRTESLPPWAVRMLADTHVTHGSVQSATRLYEILLEHPQFIGDAGVLNNLANLYARNDLEKARETALRAMQAEEENSAAVLDTLGWILTRQSQYEEALPYLRRAYAINSRDPEIRYHTAEALVGLGRNAEAKQELEAALREKGDFVGREDAEKLLASLESEAAAP